MTHAGARAVARLADLLRGPRAHVLQKEQTLRRVLNCPHIAWQVDIQPAGLRAVGDEPADLCHDLEGTFMHFIDLNRRATGARVRAVADLPDAMRDIEPDRKTDILLCSASGRVA